MADAEQAHKPWSAAATDPVCVVSNLKKPCWPLAADDLARYEEGLRQAGLPE